MREFSVECVYESKDKLGESPIWIEEKNSIFWLDIKKNIIHKIKLKNNKYNFWEFEEPISCIAHIKENKFIAGTKNGFKFINLDQKKLTPIINPEINLPNNRFNDGKCDNKGRFYAGTMNEIDNKKTGSFYLLNNELDLKKIDTGYSITNGPTFSNNYKKIYLTDTLEGKIFSADLNEDGTIKEKKLFTSIPFSEGKPDGMTVDIEGFLWVAIFGGSCVNKYNNNGQIVDKIILPVSCVTSCVFGGKNLDILFITSASFTLNKNDIQKEPLAGSLFKVKTNSKGSKTNKFLVKNL